MSSKAVPAGSRILVTGVTGFIASHVADRLLKEGYLVRGTARSQSKADHLKKRFAQYGDKFEVVEVSDLEKEGGFDDAVKDVAGICHLASPVTFNPSDPFKDMINPAVNGTLSLLNSALKHGNNLRHVVVTSSSAAIAHPAGPGYEYTESDWNDQAIESFKNWKEGDSFSGEMAYTASKNEAERAVWRFRSEQTPNFGISTVLPTYTFGPVIHKIDKPEDINVSVAFVFSYLSGQKQEVEVATNPYVDVRDIALMHVRALERGDVTDGERFIGAGGLFTWQSVVDVLRKRYPERKDRIVEGEPGKKDEKANSISGKKATEVLGIDPFISFEQSIVDSCESIKHFLKE